MKNVIEHSISDINASLKEKNNLFFFDMLNGQERFIRCKNSQGRMPRRRLVESGNKWGKTEVGIAEDIAHALGYRPWLSPEDADYRVPVKVPNQGLIGCETMTHSVPEKIEPTLKRLIPDICNIKAKKNPQGYWSRVTIVSGPNGKSCGSNIHIRSYDQEAATYEGIDYDWMHWDEPPPEPIIQAAERGKIASNAPSWFTMTPLKEAYIYDKFSLHAKNMGGNDDEIHIIRGEIWENCMDVCFNCGRIITENQEFGEDGHQIRKIGRCPACKWKLGFIAKQGIDEYLKNISDPAIREAREKGIWKHLKGLVYKALDRNDHICEDFTIPYNWMRIEGIDPHDARPSCYLFGAVSPEEIEIFDKVRYRIYFYKYLLLRDDLDSIVRTIKSTRESYGYSKPKWIVLDAKYGARTEMDAKTWEDELRKRNLGNIILSESKPGDVELGHKIVREYLKGHYSTLIGESKPGMMFMDQGCSGESGPIHSMFNYQYKEGKDAPDDKFKDFPDIIRYMALAEPIYSSPEREAEIIDYLKEKQERAINLRRGLTRVQGGKG